MLLKCLDYIERFLKIRAKDGSIIPFILNAPQRRLYGIIKEQWEAGKPVRIIILKARQMGFSTLTEAIIFWMVVTAFHMEALIVAHKDEATRNLFRMSKRFLELLPKPLKPMQQASNAQELVFDKPAKYKGKGQGLGSRIRCATAGGDGIGRSYTEMALHLSEFAFWPGDKLATLIGLLQSVPDLPGTLIVIESTANGFDEFKKQWDLAVAAQQAGLEGFIPVFFAWYEMPEYRRPVPPGFERTQEETRIAETYGLDDEQLAWRRWAIQNNCGGDIQKFHQEYPSSPDEAFISTGFCVFDKESLVLRRKQVQQLKWEHGSFRIRRDISGRINSWQWEPQKRGPVRILKHPQKNVPYVLSGDTAGTGSDFFAGHVLDNRTGEQVAVIHHQFGERAFAEQVYCLGITVYDEYGKAETVYLARSNDRVQKVGANNSHKVLDKLARYRGDNVRALATVHISEALATSKHENATDEHMHQWMDEKGWEYRTTYLQDRKGDIYEAMLNIANGRDRRILYDINNIRVIDKKRGAADGVVPSTENGRGSHINSNSTDMVAENQPNVKAQDEQFSFSPSENNVYYDVDITEEQTEQAIAEVAAMRPVAELRGNEFSTSGMSLLDEVVRMFEDLGGSVFNRTLGDVVLNKRGVKDDLAHGMSENKAAAFAAIPEVIEQGGVVHYEKNWKGRGYDTATIAAPISIAGEDYLMAVVVHRRNQRNRFYIHDVYTEKEATPFNRGRSERNGLPGGVTSTISIMQKILDVKKNLADGGEEEQYSFTQAEDWQQAQGGKAEAAGENLIERLPVKAAQEVKRLERQLVNGLGRALNVPFHAKREFLQPMVRDITTEYLRSGKVSQETVDQVFETAYEQGVVEDREFYDQYKDIKSLLSKTKVTISDADKADIADYDGFVTNANKHRALWIAKEGGTPVDSFYEELRYMAPDLFPAEITHG